jgi:hypothetical protein
LRRCWNASYLAYLKKRSRMSSDVGLQCGE